MSFIASEIARALTAEYQPRLITKIRGNEKFAYGSYNSSSRTSKLEEVYSVDKSIRLPDECTILVVDDLTTTGATFGIIKSLIQKICPTAQFYFFAIWKTKSNSKGVSAQDLLAALKRRKKAQGLS
jgi:predicted amidophosphoribosyltransferase